MAVVLVKRSKVNKKKKEKKSPTQITKKCDCEAFSYVLHPLHVLRHESKQSKGPKGQEHKKR